jgi:hypothetical protein
MVRIGFHKLLFLSLTMVFFAQAKVVKVSHIGWEINIPDKYKMVDSTTSEDRLLLRFKRQAIPEAKGTPIFPNIAIILETVPKNLEVKCFADKYLMKTKDIWRIDKIDSTFIPNAIWVTGFYLAKQKGKPVRHEVYAVYQKKGMAGIQIIFDSTESVFDVAQKEFMAAIKSIRTF